MASARDEHSIAGHQRLARRAEERLHRAFRSAGWTVSRPRGPDSPDLLVRRGNKVYAVEIKASAGRARRPVLRALLADAILQARVKAKEQSAEPLPVLITDSVSNTIAWELDAYVNRFSGGGPWGVLDDRGRFELHGPELDSVMLDAGERGAGPHRRRSGTRELNNPFTDLGQWLLKVLIASRVPESWLNAPRRPIRTVADLAGAGEVSVASAARILAALEDGGFLSRTSGVLALQRLEALFSSWRTAAQRPARDSFARFLLPASDKLAHLRASLAEHAAAGQAPGARMCLGLFSACSELGLGFVRGAPIHLYVEDPSDDALEDLGLHPAPRSDAEVIVRRPAFPEAVFRACVQVNGTPVSDIVQCWLDVSYHPARGAEQAAEIARHLGIEELAG